MYETTLGIIERSPRIFSQGVQAPRIVESTSTKSEFNSEWVDQ